MKSDLDANIARAEKPVELSDDQVAHVAGGRVFGAEMSTTVTLSGLVAQAIGAAGKAAGTAIASGKG